MTTTQNFTERGVTHPVTLDYNKFIEKNALIVGKDPYQSHPNPKDIVDLSLAVNYLMDNELCSRLMLGDALDFQPHHIHYYDTSGTEELKNAVSSFLSRHFQPRKPVLPSNMVVLAGATSCLESLGYALFDPNDVIIVPTPVYNRIFTDFMDVSGVCTEPLNMFQCGKGEEGFLLDAKDLECHILKLKQQQKNVRGIILINPHNPLGQVYSPHIIMSILQVCAKYKLHVIMDEIYALSVFDEDVEFKSVLSLDLPDPKRTHFIWALTKDFCLAGLRVGVIVTECQELLNCLRNAAYYKYVPSIVQHASAVLLNDSAWCDDFFLPTNKQRLKEAYQLTKERLERMGFLVWPSSAGLFIWFNLKLIFPNITHQQSLDFHKRLLDAGVSIGNGTAFRCSDPGWMRLTFAVAPDQLQKGLDRMEELVSATRKAHNLSSITKPRTNSRARLHG